MFDQLYLIAYANLVTTVCYFVIATLVGASLWAARANGFNALGVTVFGIFITCGFHHGIHAGHILTAPQLYAMDTGNWNQLLSDVLLLIPAISFLSLRRRYGLLAKGEGVILDYEKVLSEQRRERVAITDAMLDALFTVDSAGKVISVNRYTAELLGYGSHAMSGRAFADFFADPEKAQAGLELARKGDLQGYEVPMRTGNGEVIAASLNARAIHDSDGKVEAIIVVARDIREQKRLEATLRNYSEQLEAEVKSRTRELEAANQELDSFAYSISHDLRAPLRAIGGFSEIVAEDYASELDGEGIRYLERIKLGVKRMSDLIEDLLLFSRLTRRGLQTANTEIEALVEELLGYFQSEIRQQGVTIKVKDLPSVSCDPIVMGQVFQNLISNALKYSRDAQDPTIEIGAETRGDSYVFYVHDNGIGFDTQYQDKIWQPFQRLHTQDEYEGTGIGLAIVKRIVERHGGRAWADSIVNKGATFYFTLPIHTPELNDATGSALSTNGHSSDGLEYSSGGLIPTSA